MNVEANESSRDVETPNVVGAPYPLRRPYLEALLAQIQRHAGVMRFHLGEQDQNTTLGLAAETGVRDVLRQVLPSRFGVTSGFMCRPNGHLVEEAGKDDVSPQTDVILYDASRACPLYRMNEIEVVAAQDVLGVVEVKDRAAGEAALRTDEFSKGALEHVALLSEHAPGAFRSVVLLRGKERKKKKGARAALEQCKARALTSSTIPHVIYCADQNYIAIYEYISNELQFIEYGEGDSTSALADFLRILTSFFAAQGLSTTSSTLGFSLGSGVRNELEVLALKDREPLPSLRDMVASYHSHTTVDGRPESSSASQVDRSFEQSLRTFAAGFVKDLYCVPTTGRNNLGEFCSGIAVVARLKEEGSGYAASFFTLTPQGWLICADPQRPGVSPQASWVIAHERPEAYLQRICGMTPVSQDPFAPTPGKDTDTVIIEEG